MHQLSILKLHNLIILMHFQIYEIILKVCFPIQYLPLLSLSPTSPGQPLTFLSSYTSCASWFPVNETLPSSKVCFKYFLFQYNHLDIHVTEFLNESSLQITKQCFYTGVPQCDHSNYEGYVLYFHFVSLTDKAAVIHHVEIFVWTLAFVLLRES